jgi:chromosomal replication initiation ATPase DnaA
MSLMTEVSYAPETLAYSTTHERAVLKAEENARKVSCRKFLMTLCAVHPSRAAKLLVAPKGVRYSSEPEPELTSYVLAQKKIAEALPKPAEEGGRLTIMAICKVTASYFNVSLDLMLSHRRTKELLIPRQVAMYLAKTITTQTLPTIGRAMGDRDHTTVLSAIRRIEQLRTKNAELDAAINYLSSTLSQKEAA